MKKGIGILAATAVLGVAAFVIITGQMRSETSAAIEAYNASAESYNKQIATYNKAAAQVAKANEKLQDVLDAAQAVLDEGKKAYEPKTRDKLKDVVRSASEVFVDVPAQIDPFEKLTLAGSWQKAALEKEKMEAEAALEAVEKAVEKIPPVPQIPDYREQIQSVEKACKAYTDSVQKLANVTAPEDSFVRERLRKMDTVVQAQAVTDKNDPNRLLGKKGGYKGCVYFLDSRIDRDLLPAEAFRREEEPAEEAAAKGEEAGTEEAPTEEATAEEATAATSFAGTAATSDLSAPAATAAAAAAAASADTAAAFSTETATGAAVPAEEGPDIDVVMIGTAGGGAVEIYTSVDDANARNEYLAFFEGSIMDPGSHAVEGTCVIRTSKYLDGEEQEQLTEKIRQALLAVE